MNYRLFYEIFDPSLPRLGTGDDAATQKALKTALLNLSYPSHKLRILDIGCGNGAQTLQLAKHTNCKILAVDNYLPFLEELQRRAEAEGGLQSIKIRRKYWASSLPEPLFKRGVSIAGGVMVTNPDNLLEIIASGGSGYHFFRQLCGSYRNSEKNLTS